VSSACDCVGRALTDAQLARLADDPRYQARRALLARAWEEVQAELRDEATTSRLVNQMAGARQ
jgi:hypothetical protein